MQRPHVRWVSEPVISGKCYPDLQKNMLEKENQPLDLFFPSRVLAILSPKHALLVAVILIIFFRLK
jgi:hypothetical protein